MLYRPCAGEYREEAGPENIEYCSCREGVGGKAEGCGDLGHRRAEYLKGVSRYRNGGEMGEKKKEKIYFAPTYMSPRVLYVPQWAS